MKAINMKDIVLATRGSKLALVQANIVKELIEEKGFRVNIKTITTKGDKDQTTPLSKVGGNGLFIREIERALLDGKADIAIHSAKDLPYELEEGLEIVATPQAANPRDVIVMMKEYTIKDEIIIGTSSSRRQEEAKTLFPHAHFKSIRGNVDTRLKKLEDGDYDAVIFAKAGLDRLQLNLDEFFVKELNEKEMIPAPCQGIIAVECRMKDVELKQLLKEISDESTYQRFVVERYMFSLLRADCSMGIGVHSTIKNNTLELSVLFDQKKVRKVGRYQDYKKICEEIKEMLHG